MGENIIIIQKKEGIAPFDNDCLPELAIKKSEMELNETPESKQNGIRDLKRMIRDDAELKDIDFFDDFLIQYLRRHKYNINGAYKQIRNYTLFRKKDDKLFQNIPDEYFENGVAKRIFKVLPFRCSEGCPVLHFRFGEWNPHKMPVDYLLRLGIMIALQLFRDPMTQINGIKAIYDFKGTSLQHLKISTPSNIYLYCNLALNCFPGRYKGAHMINGSPVMMAIWMLAKPFFPEKLRKRVYFHSKVEHLLNYFPRYMLPTEYGGDLIEDEIRDWGRIANKEHETYYIKGQPNFY